MTELEAKVREATNNEPWGASSTLMREIAEGTYAYDTRQQVIEFIFRRFQEKEAHEWRQIYKSLTLLEYLIKNGSERVIDDAKANSAYIKVLGRFDYIDDSGRDQGINVRNRAKELIHLLSDDGLIRSERRKAQENASKYRGVSSDAVSRYSGQRSRTFDNSDYSSNRRSSNFEEYNVPAPAASTRAGRAAVARSQKHSTQRSTSTNSRSRGPNSRLANPKPQTSRPNPRSKPQEAIPDLFSFDDEPVSSLPAPKSNNNIKSNSVGDDEDDDFDDFVSADARPKDKSTSFTTQNTLSDLFVVSSSSTNVANNTNNSSAMGDFSSLLSSTTINTTSSPQTYSNPTPVNQGPNYSIGLVGNSTSMKSSNPTPKPSNNNNSDDLFSSLFSTAKAKTHSTPSSSVPSRGSTPQNKTLQQLNKESSIDILWNNKNSTGNTLTTSNTSTKNDDFDLLF